MKALFLSIAAPVAMWFAYELRAEITRRWNDRQIRQRKERLKIEREG